MQTASLSHFSDGTLRRDLVALVAQDRTTTAALLARIAEFDRRRLYRAEGHPSMFSFCVQVLHFSEDVAYKRIQAARATRRFPAILAAIATGRLHLTAVVLLAPHLRPENAEALLEAATHRTKAEIELLLAQRFPRPDLPTIVRALPEPAAPLPASGQLVPEPVAQASGIQGQLPGPAACPPPVVPAPRPELVPEPVAAAGPRPRLAPLAPQRYAIQFTLGEQEYQELRCVQALLGHQIPSGDVAQVFARALSSLRKELERTKFAATDRPRRTPPASANRRHIPAHVKRAVWQRDGGRCTFVSQSGQRCSARKLLEYDHCEPVARGGRTTVSGIRLLCRAHNQYSAERAFGLEFMRGKREAARQAEEVRAGANTHPG